MSSRYTAVGEFLDFPVSYLAGYLSLCITRSETFRKTTENTSWNPGIHEQQSALILESTCTDSTQDALSRKLVVIANPSPGACTSSVGILLKASSMHLG